MWKIQCIRNACWFIPCTKDDRFGSELIENYIPKEYTISTFTHYPNYCCVFDKINYLGRENEIHVFDWLLKHLHLVDIASQLQSISIKETLY